ncbi:MAG: CBS domain-containing protein [Gemmataceae bacterium]|nr:CBS domain-containing protein [Gemmataceae bacterium]
MTATAEETRRITLAARTAADLMTPNPVSISADAPVKEAAVLFADRGFSAAPVIDAAGRPIGVVSQADIVVHDRESVEYVPVTKEVERPPATADGEALPRGFQVEKVDRTRVRDIMTPAVFSVGPHTPAMKVIEQMLGLQVHRVFVIGKDGVLVGVISAFDILRRLRERD